MDKEIILSVSIRKEIKGGYTAHCIDLDVASQGETVDEALDNVKEAIELYFESAKELNITDEILEKIGLTTEELKEGVNLPSIFKTEIPVSLAT